MRRIVLALTFALAAAAVPAGRPETARAGCMQTTVRTRRTGRNGRRPGSVRALRRRYVGDGQRVRTQARFCRVPGSAGPKVVARLIAADGPIVPPISAEGVLGAHWRGEPGVPHDRTTLEAVLVVALGTAAVVAVGLRRRRSAARRR